MAQEASMRAKIKHSSVLGAGFDEMGLVNYDCSLGEWKTILEKVYGDQCYYKTANGLHIDCIKIQCLFKLSNFRKTTRFTLVKYRRAIDLTFEQQSYKTTNIGRRKVHFIPLMYWPFGLGAPLKKEWIPLLLQSCAFVTLITPFSEPKSENTSYIK